LKNPNGDQQPDGNKRNARNNHRGGKNKTKDKNNNGKNNDNVGEVTKEKCKVKFPCKICTNDHLTHLCPKLVEATRLLNLPPTVLTNPFPHNQHLASSSSNASNASGVGQNPSSQDDDRVCINMFHAKIDIATLSQDYNSSKASASLEAPPPPLEMNLQIEKVELPPHILKVVFKCSTHNPNAKAAHNFSIIEDLGQKPCTVSTLEVL
jgi:hypothetical protein